MPIPAATLRHWWIIVACYAPIACADPTLPSTKADGGQDDQGQLLFGDLSHSPPDAHASDPMARDLRSDRPGSRPDRGTKRLCASWIDWSCRAGAIFPCRANCAAGQTRALVCNNVGTCTCIAGNKATACPKAKPETGCALCRKAFQSGCCRP